MMKFPRSVLRPVLAIMACVSIAACANTPPRQTEMDYRSKPSPTLKNANDGSGKRLTIQSGEGERLNLPWFIRDTQDWINSN